MGGPFSSEVATGLTSSGGPHTGCLADTLKVSSFIFLSPRINLYREIHIYIYM